MSSLISVRIIWWGWIGLGLAIIAAGVWMAGGSGGLKPNGEPIAPDFAIFYLAGRLAAASNIAAAYDWTQLSVTYQNFFAMNLGGVSWNYPPPALLPFVGLGTLPYPAAVMLWSSGGLLALLGLWRPLWWPLWRSGQAGAPLLAILLFPGTTFNLISGQNGLWLAALAGGALLRLDMPPTSLELPMCPTRLIRAVLTGVLCGLVALKPSLLPLLPLALCAGRQWVALAALLLTVTVLVLVGTLAFGGAAWQGFANTLYSLGELEAAGAFPDYRMPTLYLALRRLEWGSTPALLAQSGLAAIAALAVWWVWRSSVPVHPGARAAVTAAAIPLIPPYLFEYDLEILLLPLFWLWQRHTDNTLARLLVLATGVLLVLPPLASRTLGGHPAVVLLPLLLAWTWATRRA